MNVLTVLLVGLGGSVGALARGLGSSAIQARTTGVFPWGTFCVNLAACLIGGVLLRAALPDPARLALMTGFLGGFSTLSTLNYEAMRLMQHGKVLLGVAYLLITYAVGFAAVAAGFFLAGAV